MSIDAACLQAPTLNDQEMLIVTVNAPAVSSELQAMPQVFRISFGLIVIWDVLYSGSECLSWTLVLFKHRA